MVKESKKLGKGSKKMVKGIKKRRRKVNRMLKGNKNMLKRSKKLLKGSKKMLEGSKILLEGSKKKLKRSRKKLKRSKKMLKGKWHLRAIVCILEYAYFIHIGGHSWYGNRYMPRLWHFWSLKTDFLCWQIAQKCWTVYQIIFLFNN